MRKLTVEGFPKPDNLVGLRHLLRGGEGEGRVASYLSPRRKCCDRGHVAVGDL